MTPDQPSASGLPMKSACRFVTAGLLCLALSACGGGGDSGTGTSGTTGSASAGATAGGTTTPAPAPVNHAPTLSGSPVASIDSSGTYDFLPVGADSDGDKLTFAISGKPAWASFDGSTGRLSGTPGTSGIGSYQNILISVSDGKLSTSLPAFQILVTGTVALFWTSPTQNMDGSPLTNLAGFRIYQGPAVSTLTPVSSVTSPAATGVRVAGLAAGTWYFAVAAYDTAGHESPLSNVVSKVLGN